MIRLSIDLLPMGDENKSVRIAGADIWNTGKKAGDKSCYEFKGFYLYKNNKEVQLFNGEFKHDRTKSILYFIAKFVNALLEKPKP